MIALTTKYIQWRLYSDRTWNGSFVTFWLDMPALVRPRGIRRAEFPF
ncbi:MAG: hypothetical protein Fues2KO_06160 [Fuerstiella sp.]